jgi:hypothetical protein
MSRILPAFMIVCLLCIQHAQADLHFQNIWVRSGTVDLGGTESSLWRLAMTDTDEDVQLTDSNGTLGVNGPIAPFGYVSIVLDDTAFMPGIDVTDLGGSAITRPPHDIDVGDWAYGMAVLGGSSPYVVESYFQIRLAGSSAVVQDSTLAQLAVTQGRWPSIDTYIEFNPSYAYYAANGVDPVSPSDYTGSVLPEGSTATLLLIGLMSSTLQRSQRS